VDRHPCRHVDKTQDGVILPDPVANGQRQAVFGE
jgi:hypothetical protein